MALDALDFIDHVRTEAGRFGDVLRDADPAARVPSCPDWTADDLLYHLAEVFDSWTKVVRDQVSGEDVPPPERPGEHVALLELYDRTRADLLEVMATTPRDQPMWCWVADEVTADWLPRRMAHEALIHRLDAELATDSVTDFDPALAADGVAEVVHYFYGWRPSWGEVTDGPVGRLTATDTGDGWLVRLGTWSGQSPTSGNSYTDELFGSLATEGDPSFSVRASARDLDAWLWNRPTINAPEIEGDASALQRIIARGLD
jgi:uncharacterized protein (TIGR03083 family)